MSQLGDELADAYGCMRYTQNRAAFIAGVMRGVTEALHLLEEPGALHEVEAGMDQDEVVCAPLSVPKEALRRMLACKLKHARMADAQAASSSWAYSDVLNHAPQQYRCSICDNPSGVPLETTREYGPPPKDDEEAA